MATETTENKNNDQGYTVNDRRGIEKPTEVCRVCGSGEVHTTEYNNPTMKCVDFFRKTISDLTNRLHQLVDK
ncbi:MAG TPA: hypothetical protein VI911_10600 [Patescibacteria group bacterium]|nr:hypothetical protein [Patescibacteria group bacterium]